MTKNIKCNICSAAIHECDINRFAREFDELGYLSICSDWIGCMQCSAHHSKKAKKMFLCQCLLCIGTKKAEEVHAVIFVHEKRFGHFFEIKDNTIDAIERMTSLLKSMNEGMTQMWRNSFDDGRTQDFIASLDKYLTGFERFVKRKTYDKKSFSNWEASTLGGEIFLVLSKSWIEWRERVEFLSGESSTRIGAQKLKERMSVIDCNARRDFPKIFHLEVGCLSCSVFCGLS